ncbi:MAG: hypothetical protein KC766_31345 [Myxococcales bacterium]|nr:hypothetical protein [Myxococcales bacterium]
MARHLPVIQNQDPEDAAAEERSPRGWVMVGAMLGFTMWLPLLMIAQWISARWTLAVTADGAPAHDTLLLIQLGPVLTSLMIATGGAGALVGRFGGRAGAGHAALSGLTMALGVGALSVLIGAFPSWLVALLGTAVLAAFATGAAFLGGRYGVRRRPKVG